MKSLARTEGYLLVDHRFSPGIPEDVARRIGYDPKQCGEGKVFEAATLHCKHCLGTVVKNPNRVRERAYCAKCDSYICDACHALTQQPNYLHASGEKISDLVIDAAAKGMTLGSPLELLNKPRIFVP